jgi:hypothetical protein
VAGRAAMVLLLLPSSWRAIVGGSHRRGVGRSSLRSGAGCCFGVGGWLGSPPILV